MSLLKIKKSLILWNQLILSNNVKIKSPKSASESPDKIETDSAIIETEYKNGSLADINPKSNLVRSNLQFLTIL